MSQQSNLTKDDLLRILELMMLMRRLEERAGQLYGMGLIGGFCHLYTGQEAVAAGIQNNLIEGDTVITSYRDHAFMIASGADPKVVFAELMGRETGCSFGKGGSMHMFNKEGGFYGGHGIVGAQVPIGTGLGFAMKYKEQNNMSVTIFGDGAANQGQIYESFNMAKLWNLPVLYIIENNEYAMGTSVARASGDVALHKRGESFGIPGSKVNGMDFFAVNDAIENAANLIRNKKKGPMLLELKTYRYVGHSMSDPAKYRSRDEVAEYRKNSDPIMNLKNEIIKRYKNIKDDILKIDARIKNQIEEAIDFAKNSSEPRSEELYTNVYAAK
ncbi:MAG: pyruvate dehydrogenase (acetyl-transferring) E1 component subunit alpha [Proteobacteria bacterium]|nr:pyruvate dehydrogenase (acetyl-transferring) E1 component subunit alpha [Pseudomonadota bacterium]